MKNILTKTVLEAEEYVEELKQLDITDVNAPLKHRVLVDVMDERRGEIKYTSHIEIPNQRKVYTLCRLVSRSIISDMRSYFVKIEHNNYDVPTFIGNYLMFKPSSMYVMTTLYKIEDNRLTILYIPIIVLSYSGQRLKDELKESEKPIKINNFMRKDIMRWMAISGYYRS